MATSNFKRLLASDSVDYAATLAATMITEVGGNFYIPISFDSFVSDPITAVQVDGTVGQSTLTSTTVGTFDNVRVGDFVTVVSSGTLTTPSDITRSCFTAKGLKYLVYPDTFTSGTLGVKAGDAVSGNNIPANTVVDKIDYTTRQIFLNNAVTTASTVETITFSPKVRVTAVRKSTATSNANQIDISTTVATTITDANVTIVGGANEAVCLVVRLKPVDTTSTKTRFQIEVSYQTGNEVKGSSSGYNELTFADLSYILAGDVSFDGDTFLYNARLARPTSL